MPNETGGNYTKEDLKNAKTAARAYMGRSTWYQPPRNVKKMVKEDAATQKELFEPRDSTRNASIQTKSTNADRNVRQTDQPYRSQQDIATQFNESYAKQGLQPRGLAGGGVGEASPRPQYKQPQQITRSAETTNQQRGLVAPKVSTLTRHKRLKKRGLAKRAVAKVRVTAVNTWVWSWGLWSWAIFQLPIAIFCVLFMGLTEYVHQLYLDSQKITNEKGLIETIKDDVVTAVFTVAQWISNLLGFDVTYVSPGSFFILTYLIVLVFGWFTLLFIYFQYKIAFLRPTSGRASTLKITMLLLAIIGYAIPIANIFPWFIFWTMAVWWYPK